jgi:hypothetical protein
MTGEYARSTGADDSRVDQAVLSMAELDITGICRHLQQQPEPVFTPIPEPTFLGPVSEEQKQTALECGNRLIG